MAVKITKPQINVRERLDLQDKQITTNKLDAKKVDATEEFELPSGDSDNRPLVPSAGSTRWNTENNALEIYNGSEWLELATEYVPAGSTNFGG